MSKFSLKCEVIIKEINQWSEVRCCFWSTKLIQVIMSGWTFWWVLVHVIWRLGHSGQKQIETELTGLGWGSTLKVPEALSALQKVGWREWSYYINIKLLLLFEQSAFIPEVFFSALPASDQRCLLKGNIVPPVSCKKLQGRKKNLWTNSWIRWKSSIR